jgi:hypothetical protein
MKTFKEFCEGYKEPDTERLDRQSASLHKQGKAALAAGNLSKAVKITAQLGAISGVASGVRPAD